jgi:nitrous oxidase accessory protein
VTPLAGLLVVALQAAVVPGDHGSAPSALEGRPAATHVSPLQRLIDAAEPGATIDIPAGTYDGDLLIDRPVRLIGHGWPLLRGSGTGSVVRVRADDVTIEGFVIDGRGTGDLGRDPSGVHVAGERATIRRCRIRNTLFGVYLLEAHGSAIEQCEIRGVPGREPGEKGSGIHAYATDGFRFVDNVVIDARDAIYMQNASKGVVRGNRARDMRYGLHYMFSDDNVFEDNVFENGAAGAAIMYSERIVFRRNQFLRNRGFASVGLLLQQCDDVTAEDNLIADNARGIFLEGTHRNVFRRNVVAQSDVAIMAFGSAKDTRFEHNAFFGNMTPLTLVGRRTDTVFASNYWSSHTAPDLDGDGFSDRPYRLMSVFDHMRGNLTAADLYVDGFAGTALALAEVAFPVLEPVSVVEAQPLARPPRLPDVPRPDAASRRSGAAMRVVALTSLALGLVVLVRGRRLGAHEAWR